eukprot:7729479-Pyramimonas_sp.AAC.2
MRKEARGMRGAPGTCGGPSRATRGFCWRDPYSLSARLDMAAVITCQRVWLILLGLVDDVRAAT